MSAAAAARMIERMNFPFVALMFLAGISDFRASGWLDESISDPSPSRVRIRVRGICSFHAASHRRIAGQGEDHREVPRRGLQGPRIVRPYPRLAGQGRERA